MLSKCRFAALLVAVGSGFATGWITSRVGGSVDQAVGAVLVMVAGLGGMAVLVGLFLGLVNDRAASVGTAVALLASFYAATWLASPFHSLAGDALFMAVAAILTGGAAAVGHLVGRALPQYLARKS